MDNVVVNIYSLNNAGEIRKRTVNNIYKISDTVVYFYDLLFNTECLYFFFTGCGLMILFQKEEQACFQDRQSL